MTGKAQSTDLAYNDNGQAECGQKKTFERVHQL